MLIARIANFVHATSGGLRTALRELGRGYLEAGHEAVLIVPGAVASDEQTDYGRVITLPGPMVPGLGGYRVLLNRIAVGGLLRRLEPDRIEVHDRSTLRWTGAWARRAGVPALMVSHESLDGLLRLYGPGPVGPWIAGALNRRTVAAFDTVVCTTGWAAREFTRFGGAPLRVPLGVDLERFSPAFRDEECAGEVMLLHCGRLSAEKQPHLSLNTLAELRAGGIDAELVVAGDGPLREALEAEAVARKLPARFLGYVGDPRGLLATADVVLAPGPIETFGLAALEALASGTPVVVRSESALPEVIGQAGVAAEGDGASFAAAARTLLDRPESERRAAARAQAERFPWSRSVDGFLAAHRIPKAAPRFARGAALPLPPG
ncbi:alpha-1,6-mannosyltransferase [Actinoplanes lutulentus]|nr:glycosyltransferase [Actinoplanes lutulentus]MBB2948042.1 alpha-1,6-mannosyltransferase [Actinoplanes lutulentus]